MTHAETAQDLLEAVGVEWKQRADLCRDSRPAYELGGDNTAYFAATNSITYTGPALGTLELDAILLVAGFKWIRERLKHCEISELDNDFYEAFGRDIGWETRLVYELPDPGHALARAIREVGK